MTSENAAEAGHAGAEAVVLMAQFAMHDEDVPLLPLLKSRGSRNVLDGSFKGVERQRSRFEKH